MARISTLALILSLLIWQQVAAQNVENILIIPTGQTTYEVTAGQPLTVEWTNPSSGTVTIKLQEQTFTPDGGIILTAGIPASTLTATLTIPMSEHINISMHVLEIINDIDPNKYSISPSFFINLGTGSASSVTEETLVTPTTIEESSITPMRRSTYNDSGPENTESQTSRAPSTTDQTDTSERNEDSPGLSTGVIVAIAVGGALMAFLIGALLFRSARLHRRDKKMWDVALNAVEEAHTNGYVFKAEYAQDRAGRDREVSGQDTYQTHSAELPVSYRLDGTMTPSNRELLTMLRNC